MIPRVKIHFVSKEFSGLQYPTINIICKSLKMMNMLLIFLLIQMILLKALMIKLMYLFQNILLVLSLFFTRDDQIKFHDPKKETYVKKFQERQKINIGTRDSPKYVNLGTSCTKEEIDQYTTLFKEFYDFYLI
jgi:hypothetical protein